MFSPRPLVTALMAQTLLDVSEDEIVELLDEGLIGPVFNICTPGSKEREIRILSAGLTYYATLQRPLPADPREVISDVVPVDAPITSVSLRRTLNCSQQLIYKLLASKSIFLAPGEHLKPGPHNAAKVVRSSVLDFLEKRLI